MSFNRIKYALQHFWSRCISGEQDNDRADGGPDSHFSKVEARFIAAEMANLTDNESADLVRRRLEEKNDK